MYLSQLSLVNFRNYVRLSLDLPRRVTVLQGANAQGKTNFLESIYYLAAARSPSATSDAQLINRLARQDDLPYARIEAEVSRQGTESRIEITLAPNVRTGGFRKYLKLTRRLSHGRSLPY